MPGRSMREYAANPRNVGGGLLDHWWAPSTRAPANMRLNTNLDSSAVQSATACCGD